MRILKKTLTVKLTIVWLVLGNVVTIIFFLFLVSVSTISKEYIKIEKNEVIENLQRVNNATKNTISQLTVKLVDWAFWDDTYKFIQDQNEAYLVSNLTNGSISNLKINGMLFVDTTGKIIFKKAINFNTLEDVSSENIASYVLTHQKLNIHANNNSFVEGIISLPEGPALISSAAILTSEAQGPSRGSLMFIKFFNDDMVTSMGKLTHTSLKFYNLNSSTLPEDVLNAKRNLSNEYTYYVNPASQDLISGYGLLDDIYGNPTIIFKIDESRNLYNQGQSTLFLFIIVAGSLVMIFGIVLILLFEKFITSRIQILGKEVETISVKGDLTLRVYEGDKDEIGRLAIEINHMFEALNSSKMLEKEAMIKIQTEKKKVEGIVIERTKELSAEKARLLASINSIPFGFIIADIDNKILLKNTAMTNLFNLSDIQNLHLSDIGKLLGKDLNLNSAVDLCMQGKSICEIKKIVLENKILRGIIAPITTIDVESHGEAIGYVFMLEDITEANALERSRDEFFSIASHELRTPLTAIRGNSKMLQDNYKDKMVDKDMSEMVDDIHESSLRLIDLVNDFLEVSRLEQGRMEIKKEKFDLSEIVLKVMKDVEEMVNKKGLKIIYAPSSDASMTVLSDKSKVEQLLFNLIGNSIKFTNKGSITIQIEKIPGFLKIKVIDTGIGISDLNQTLLFRKFQQAGEHVLARDDTKGTGLGLYICQLLISKLGGTIGLEKSVLGEGSTFSFTLPIGS